MDAYITYPVFEMETFARLTCSSTYDFGTNYCGSEFAVLASYNILIFGSSTSALVVSCILSAPLILKSSECDAIYNLEKAPGSVIRSSPVANSKF